MSEASIRDDIKDALNGVSNIGNVHDYERWSADWTTYLSLFKATISGSSVIRGWTVGYDGYAPFNNEQYDFSGGVLRTHRFKARGFLGLDDSAASEKTAATLAETVCNAFDNDPVLHDTSVYFDCAPASLDVFEQRLFGSVLCHYIEISLEITEFRT